MVYSSIVSFYVPFIVTLLVYIKIYIVLRRRRKRVSTKRSSRAFRANLKAPLKVPRPPGRGGCGEGWGPGRRSRERGRFQSWGLSGQLESPGRGGGERVETSREETFVGTQQLSAPACPSPLLPLPSLTLAFRLPFRPSDASIPSSFPCSVLSRSNLPLLTCSHLLPSSAPFAFPPCVL